MDNREVVSNWTGALMLAAALCFCAASGPAIAEDVIYVDRGRGQVAVWIPSSYDPETPAPLVMLLHAFSYSGSQTEAYLKFRQSGLMEEFGFLYLYPDGTTNDRGYPFWNATDACCDFDDSGVDDSGYLLDLIEAIEQELNVDSRRVYLVGYSNGGFMSYRMACDHADKIAAIASMGGATYLDPEACAPGEPVHVLEIHGTVDGIVQYGGGDLCDVEQISQCDESEERLYPGAVETVEQWAIYNGCTTDQIECPPLDLERNLPGSETTVKKYITDCATGGSAELWSTVGGGHFPVLSDDCNRLVIEYLFAHPKPSSCPADLDESGVVDFVDLLAVLSAWGGYEPCPEMRAEDLDRDLDVGFSDLLVVLAAWGPCD